MSIETDIAAVRAKCSEAYALGMQIAVHSAECDPARMPVKLENGQLRRLLDEMDRLMAPKNRRLPQDGFCDTDGMGY